MNLPTPSRTMRSIHACSGAWLLWTALSAQAQGLAAPSSLPSPAARPPMATKMQVMTPQVQAASGVAPLVSSANTAPSQRQTTAVQHLSQAAPPPPRPAAGALQRAGFAAAPSQRQRLVGGAAATAVKVCDQVAAPQPEITAVEPASGERLVPGELFIVRGHCLGNGVGRVELRLGAAQERSFYAQVVDWKPSQLQLAMPTDIRGVPPGRATVNLTTARGLLASAEAQFWPQWELVNIEARARSLSCDARVAQPAVRGWCQGHAGGSSPPCQGLQCVGFKSAFGPEVPLRAVHVSDTELGGAPVEGSDRWTFDLPPYAQPVAWQLAVERPKGSKNSLEVGVDATRRELWVRWRLADAGDIGFLAYGMGRIQAWMPVGVAP
ncbi:MAG: hypothetical protein O9335_02710 [Inhella sp.]|jgi:hypothetical protein|uniref:hypothetical protein n=1 Tax=Inhella sp. TaxID=1921806 RepID=UPI0022CD0F74|nr:hypothetical protein [Inhella sp.]MCZ8234047.1 hypothetical protein [Inhella sp.]